MTNRSLLAVLLFACAVTLTVPAHAQVFVLSHTTVENGSLNAECETQMEDPTTIALYPHAIASCTLIQNGVAIQAFPECIGSPKADCNNVTGPEIEGAGYETTTTHELEFQLLTTTCTQNGVFVPCFWDPLSYGLPLAPIPPNRIFTDRGEVPFANVQSFWAFGNGSPNFIIASTAETQFQTAQIIPFIFHAKAGDTELFRTNGSQNANWTFAGISGTTSPAAPSQGTSITFAAPKTVPVQQVDTLTACKVDTSHGTDCNSAQIIVEVLGVSILPGDPNEIPPSNNPTELLGGQMFQYKATVTQGAATIVSPVTWSSIDNSGLDLISVNPSTGFVTVQPQSKFQGGDFFVDIKATSTIDPAVAFSAPFSIHIPTVAVTYTTLPTPGVNDTPTTFEANPGRPFNFAASVSGPINPQNRVISSWNQNFIPTFTDFSEPGVITLDPSRPDIMEYVITSPPPKGTVLTTIRACVGGHLDAFASGLVDATCAEYPLLLSPPVFPTSQPQSINSGESTPVTITGTGFGAAPNISFADPRLTFMLTSVSGPDANGVTTVHGTMTAAPIALNAAFTYTITSSLPPPSTPDHEGIAVRSVTTAPAVAPVNPTLIISQSQQFTPSLGCVTFGGQTCTVPQTSTCSLISGPGTITTSCLYTAPASLAAQTQVQAQACFTFGNVCKTFSINLVPVGVAVAPATASLDSTQSQQFVSTVTSVPSNNQATNWSISPLVGSISAVGVYTAPAVVTSLQTVSVTGCSAVDSLRCASATVTLNPVTVAITPSTPVTLAQGQTEQFQATVTHSPNAAVVWSLSPVVGSISSTGLYTAPPAVTSKQTVVVKACSVIAPGNCGSSSVNLIPPDFALSVSPNSGPTGLGFETSFDVFVAPIGGFGGTVTFTATVPAGIGMTPTFSPATITASGFSVAQFAVLSSTPEGTYPITITGTSGSLAHSIQITVTVVGESITVTASAPQTAAPGTTVTFTFNVTNNGFIAAGDGINVTGIPPGSTVIPTATTGGIGLVTVEFTTATTLAPGTYPITYTASDGSLTGSATTSLTIPAPPPPTPSPTPTRCTTRNCLNQ